MINKAEYQDKKLVAFDLFGTCISHCPSDFRLSGEIGNFFKTNPVSVFDVENDVIEKDGLKIDITTKLKDKVRQDLETAFIFPDVLEALKYIKSKGYQTAVVSNLGKDYLEPLHRLIPEGFDYEVLSFNVGAVKPDTKIYEYLKSLSGTDFKDIVMIGDSLKADVLGSNNVGITPIYLNRDSIGGIEKVYKKGLNFIQISTLADLKEIF